MLPIGPTAASGERPDKHPAREWTWNERAPPFDTPMRTSGREPHYQTGDDDVNISPMKLYAATMVSAAAGSVTLGATTKKAHLPMLGGSVAAIGAAYIATKANSPAVAMALLGVGMGTLVGASITPLFHQTSG